MNKNNDEADLAKVLTVGMNTYLDGRGMRVALDKTDISVRRIVVPAAPGPNGPYCPVAWNLWRLLVGPSHQVFSYAELLTGKENHRSWLSLDSAKPENGSNSRIFESANAGCFLVIPKKPRVFAWPCCSAARRRCSDFHGQLADVLEAAKFIASLNSSRIIQKYEPLPLLLVLRCW
jgi:hypothetical protein